MKDGGDEEGVNNNVDNDREFIKIIYRFKIQTLIHKTLSNLTFEFCDNCHSAITYSLIDHGCLHTRAKLFPTTLKLFIVASVPFDNFTVNHFLIISSDNW